MATVERRWRQIHGRNCCLSRTNWSILRLYSRCTNNKWKGGEKIAKKSSGPRNGPSKTGNPSGGGRGNNPSKK